MKFLDSSYVKKINELGYLRQADAMPNITPNNIGMPAGILSQVSVEVAETILAYRSGDEALGGRKKLLDWEQQDYYLPLVEKTGSVEPYSDYDDAVASGLNVTFGRTGHYLFSTSYNVGEREAMQLAQGNINSDNYLMSASLEALAVELNRVAFNGYVNNNNSFLVYGLLNNPSLANYENSDKKFSAMTYQECVAFFAKAIAKLRSQTGNNIQRGSKLRVVVASNAFDSLALKFTDLGVDAITALIDKFQKLGVEITITPAIELDGANASQDVIYFILENSQGGINETSTLGYSEIGRMSNVVLGTTYKQQKVSAGTTGAVIYKPAYIVRYTNI